MLRLVVLLFALLAAIPAAAATNYVRYVNPNADAGGNGTTNATTGANCAFQSLSLAEAAGGGAGQPPLDLTAASDTLLFECATGGNADTSAVTILGWTTSSSYYITVQANSSHRASTSWDTGKYRLDGTSTGFYSPQSPYTRTVGLQIRSSAIAVTPDTTSNYQVIDSCLIVGSNSGSTGLALSVPNTFGGSLYVLNTIMIANSYSTSEAAQTGGASGTTCYFYSCTFVGANYGLRRLSRTVNAKNCYASGTTSYGGTITKTTCASSDATTGTTGLTSVAYSTSSGAYFANVTAGSEDLKINSASSTLIGAGTNTSGESAPLNFSDDINSLARGAAWDVGADEYDAVAGGIFPGLFQHHDEVMK